MIILPDKNIPRTKFLLPILDKEWKEPSQAVPKDMFGNPVEQTRFRIRAKTHDGVVLWCGWFDDRYDFDQFLWAISYEILDKRSSLWDLPTPAFPGLDPGLVYDFATVTFLSSTSVSSYSIPNDWSSANNKIEAVGAGGNARYAGTTACAGAGGGAYASISNVAGLSGSIAYRVGIGGGTTGSGISPTNNSYFKDGSTLVAAGGDSAINTLTGASGGTVANCFGTVKNAGGNGGTYSPTNSGSCGAGGAGGPNGAGLNGGNTGSVTPGSYGTAGGAGNNGLDGAGGLTSSSGTGKPGGNGTYWDSTVGSLRGLGGGGGGAYYNGGTGGAAGNYGGGGGGGAGASSSLSTAAIGLIVVTYTPIPFPSSNMPNLGM